MAGYLKSRRWRSCSGCREDEHKKKLFVCGGCKGKSWDPPMYCSVECQKEHWKTHKAECLRKHPLGKPELKHWTDEFRKCKDDSYHFGDLEMVTWSFNDLGWGGILKEESDDLKEKFEKEFKRDQRSLYLYWPGAFRWTCCGLSADMTWGCDHHGDPRAPKPCTCDFCRAGRPLPEKLYKKKTAHNLGLNLLRGPDPRSFSGAGALNWMLRSAFYGALGRSAEEGIGSSSDDDDYDDGNEDERPAAAVREGKLPPRPALQPPSAAPAAAEEGKKSRKRKKKGKPR